MTDLFLIAHKVRGEPAFDIAQHMTCPKCDATDVHCTSCDGQGHWWIIPTSGHRAFPWWNHPLNEIKIDDGYDTFSLPGMFVLEHMPPSLRDHYTSEREASVDLIKVLGLLHAPLTRTPPLKRRF